MINIPYYTQAVEQSVRLVTESVVAISGSDGKEGLI